MTDWTHGRLDTAETEEILRKAGLDPDCSNWTEDDTQHAALVLFVATERKRHRLEQEGTR